MSKVVHISDEAHAKAKAYCKQNDLRMSDWVGELIYQATEAPVRVGAQRAGVTPVPRKQLRPEPSANAAPDGWVIKPR